MVKEKKKSEQMSSLVKKWRASGLSKQSFCRKEGINVHTFGYWIDKERVELPSKGFIEVITGTAIKVKEQGEVMESGGLIEISFPQGAILRLNSSLSESDLKIVKTLLY
jgi:hypothetical protein